MNLHGQTLALLLVLVCCVPQSLHAQSSETSGKRKTGDSRNANSSSDVSQDKKPAEAGTELPRGREIIEVEGTLAAVAGDRIKIKDEQQDEYFAVLSRMSKLTYKGTADAKFLRPGFMLRFEADFDMQQGIALSPVGELEVFRPSQSRRLQPEERQSQTPGVYPAKADDKQKDGPRNVRQAASRVIAQKNRFLVVGQLRVVQPTKLQVLVRNRPIIVDINEDTKITVSAGDVMYCLPGDKVKLTGTKVAGQQNLLQVATLEVEGANPIGERVAAQSVNGDESKMGRG